MESFLSIDKFAEGNTVGASDIVIGYAGVIPIQMSVDLLFKSFPDGSVSSTNIQDKQLTDKIIYPLSVSTDKFKEGAVGSTKIEKLAIKSEHLIDESITPDKIKDKSVPGSKLTHRTTNPDKILTAIHFPSNAVTSPAIAENAIDTKHLTSSSPVNPEDEERITGTQLADKSINSEHLAFTTSVTESLLQIDVRGRTGAMVTYEYRQGERYYMFDAYLHILIEPVVPESEGNGFLVDSVEGETIVSNERDTPSAIFAKTMLIPASSDVDCEYLVTFPDYAVGTELKATVFTSSGVDMNDGTLKIRWRLNSGEEFICRQVTSADNRLAVWHPPSFIVTKKRVINHLRIHFSTDFD